MDTGLGIIKPLVAGIDCPDYATFFSGFFYKENGAPLERPQLACLFERTKNDPAWRHGDPNGTFGRPTRELVLRTVATVGNYDYVLDWRFGQDNAITVGVRATGILEVKPAAIPNFLITGFMTSGGANPSKQRSEHHLLPIHIESPLGLSLVSGWSVSASFVPYDYNDFDPVSGTPLLSFPSPFPADRSTPGAASFYYAFPIHYKNPSVQQWNLTYERDLGFRTGLRLSYTGSHGANLETMEGLNQIPASTNLYTGDTRPYQDWQVLQSVYNALSEVVEKQAGNCLSFQSSYVFTRDLSDEGGAAPSVFDPCRELPHFETAAPTLICFASIHTHSPFYERPRHRR